MLDLMVTNARLHGRNDLVQIGCKDGKITGIGPDFTADAKTVIDAKGCLTTLPFVDSHIHLDTCLTLGAPRMNQICTLLEGIEIWKALAPTLTPETINARATQLLSWAIAR